MAYILCYWESDEINCFLLVIKVGEIDLNVVIIVLDTLRKDHVGIYGNSEVVTPNLDALARESIIFEDAHPESLPTIPFRRSTHTGIRTFPFKEYHPRKGDMVQAYGWEPIPETQTTLAEILRREGYTTAFITDTYHYFKPSMNFHRGFAQWQLIRGQEVDPYRTAPKPDQKKLEHHIPQSGDCGHMMLILPQYLTNISDRRTEEDYFSPQVFNAAIKWIEQNREVEKFFLFIDSFDPHEPWDPPQIYRDLYYSNYSGREVITPNYSTNTDYLTSEELNYMKALYAGEVTMVDTWLGKFIKKMRKLELLDKSLLILISDHGHQLGEHNVMGKIPRGLYPELMDIPFFIRHPDGLNMGKRVSGFVYNHDIVPTILQFLEVESPVMTDGNELWSLINGEQEARSYATSGFNGYVWIKDGEFVYISNYSRSREYLFDLKKDPNQNQNIIEENRDIADMMFQRILHDAGGKLVDHSAIRAKASEEWYKMEGLV
ncbi:MAG: sulfatase [Candidatus Jordarchaeum sp.]|uniref:sulfatase n=1 Tax=Candidatus Jordarchaeum sp. TaxID=2823881 RepID=UPI0040493321